LSFIFSPFNIRLFHILMVRMLVLLVCWMLAALSLMLLVVWLALL